MSRWVCDILDDDNASYGVNVDNVRVCKQNRKWQKVVRIDKTGVHALDDN